MEAMPSQGRSLPERLPAKFKRGCDVLPDGADGAPCLEVTYPGLHVERYGRRFWAVWDGPMLVCVTVYLKGARSVIDLVTALRSEARRRGN